MKHVNFQRSNGSALIMVLAILFILSVLAVSFVKFGNLERAASENYVFAVRAKFASEAGMQHAAGRLLDDYSAPIIKSPTNEIWRFRVPDPDAILTPSNNPSLFAEDDIGAGVLLENVFSTNDLRSPSFPTNTLPFGRKVSGIVPGAGNEVFTLKIFDTTSQLNLNSQIDAASPTSSHANVMGQLLDNLSRGIALREPYKTLRGDAIGPLKGLGNEIIQRREAQGGYRTKLELLGVSNALVQITEQDLAFAWDYLTVYPLPSEMTNDPYFVNIRPDGGNETFGEDHRSPININSASWPVLFASVSGLSRAAPFSITVSDDEAIVLANQICERRRDTPFTGWIDFYQFVDGQTTTGGAFHIGGVQATNAHAKAEIVKANCDPNVTLRRLNPDLPAWQELNKTDLSHYTTEFCFFPAGYFEVTSLGQILSLEGDPEASVQIHSVVKVFDVLYQSTQESFEGANSDPLYVDPGGQPDASTRFAPYVPGSSGINAFAYPNALQTVTNLFVLEDRGSRYFGYVQPVATNLHLTTATNVTPGSVDFDGNYLFRADFNGTLDGFSRDIPDDLATGRSDAHGTKSGAQPAAPDSGMPGDDLVVDGVIFRSFDSKTLSYVSRINASPPDAAGNFPPLTTAQPNDGSPNQGTLMFWFKLNNDWVENEWRTVMFSNTSYDQPAPGMGLANDTLFCGIQREVRMRVTGPSSASPNDADPARPLLRSLDIQVRNKWYTHDLHFNRFEEHPVNTTPNFMPYQNVLHDRTIEIHPDGAGIGVRAHAWYHLAIRWHDGTSMTGFPQPPGNAGIILHGEFFDPNDDLELMGGLPLRTVVDEFLPLNEQIQPYQPFLPDQDFGSLLDPNPAIQQQYADLKVGEFMHIGSPGVSPSPAMILDDIRISQVSNFLNDPEFLPSRYPQPAQQATTLSGTGEYYGIHQMFLPDFNGQPPVFTMLTVRVSNPAPSNAVMPVAVVDTSAPPFRLEIQFPATDATAPLYGRPIVDDVTLVYARAPEFIEFFERYSPWDVDQDNDGIPDAVEDADQDQVVDPNETDPTKADTDMDGIQDGTEIGAILDHIGLGTDTNLFQPDLDPASITDPLLADTDGEGLTDGAEDADQNGMIDPGETDPNDPDSDDDFTTDFEESVAGTDPNDPDSVLAISSLVTNAAGAFVVQFQCVAGKAYAIEFTDDSATAAWNVATGAVINLVGPGTCEWTDDGTLTGGLPGESRGYRVKVIP